MAGVGCSHVSPAALGANQGRPLARYIGHYEVVKQIGEGRFGTVFLATRAPTWGIRIGAVVFGLAMVALYSTSSLYHTVPWRHEWKRRMQRLDHSMILVLVAGTYTPIAIATLERPFMWIVLGLIWGAVLVGFAQHGGRRGGMSQRQMDPNKVPKIGVVYGTVVDSASGSPISYASVAIINNRSNTIMTGGITNKDGEFHIKEIALGRHKVLIEYIGYKKVELGPYTFMPFGGNQTEYNLETISLTQTTLQMAGVDVEGERPLFIQTAEKRVFNVEKNSLSTGGNAIDALRQVPGVEVDPDDNISLRGSSRVNLMIDGKPSSIAGGDVKSLLQSIPSANIADIEVMTNPGAKYDPEGMAGIINIVLKENQEFRFRL